MKNIISDVAVKIYSQMTEVEKVKLTEAMNYLANTDIADVDYDKADLMSAFTENTLKAALEEFDEDDLVVSMQKDLDGSPTIQEWVDGIRDDHRQWIRVNYPLTYRINNAICGV